MISTSCDKLTESSFTDIIRWKPELQPGKGTGEQMEYLRDLLHYRFCSIFAETKGQFLSCPICQFGSRSVTNRFAAFGSPSQLGALMGLMGLTAAHYTAQKVNK